MKSYISTVIITQLSLLTLIVFVTKNKVLPKRVKTGIITASALIMICAFAEFSGVLLDGAATVLKPLHIVVKYIEFCVAPIIPLVFSYAFYPMKSKEMIFLPPIIHIAFETLSLFLGIIFYIDDKNVYHHGELYWLYYLFVFLSVLYLFFTVAKFEAQFQNRNRSSLFILLAFLTVGVVFQNINNDAKIVWLTVAIDMILFYIYYCNMIHKLDALTELLNRRAYEMHISSLKRKAYIILFDVNNFKSINDTFGHNSGDMCLKSVASAIRKVYHKSGLCYRVGGDEFCVIIDHKADFCKIEDLNAKFKNQISKHNNDIGTATSVAIGYALFEPNKTKISDTVKKADEQMYLNKNHTNEP